ncbi:MAG TPA: GNAT family N-acetyltransferase [Methylotenera sp.]|nr:GNAT family N-acetyltransferase [Methylotenera sp.]HPH06539.1 GNAT family N-acetyltransferase [Methylotenera sp.]HPN01797.1 GNAT family N-acetyltransferase [Methylotenera sp.]
MEKILFCEAKVSDIPDLVNLLSVLFTIEVDFKPDFSKQKRGLELLVRNNTTANIQVAKNASGRVIGMVTSQLVISTAEGAASAWIEDMVVDVKYRGQGIGKQLLQNTLDWAKHNGATRAQLLVDIENTKALGYYDHLKWESTQLQARRLFL